MKNLKNLIENIIPVITLSFGFALTGMGIYNLEEKKIEDGKLIISLGAIIATFGGGFYFGKEYGKKNYQTKPEDYQIKK